MTRALLVVALVCGTGCIDESSNQRTQANRCRLLLSLDTTRADSVRTLLSKEKGYRYDCAAWIAFMPETGEVRP